MKYVLSGTAIAALFIAAPVWAQSAAPMTPSPSAPSATSAPMASTGSHMRSHRVKARHHRQATRRGSSRASDNMANQLNAEELAKSGGGGMAGPPGGMGGPPAPAYGGPRTAPYGQPNQIYGIPGAGRGSSRASDNMANQLNAEELAKSGGGGMAGPPGGMGGPPAPAYGGPRTAPYGQPNQLYGIPGAAQPSASSPSPYR